MKNLFFILLLSSGIVRSKDSIAYNNQVKIEIMQNEINHLQKQLENSQQHSKDLLDAKKDEIEKLMQEKENALDSRMVMYVSFFVAAILTVFGFFKWLGKTEIRRIVDEQSTKKLDEQLEIKLSANVIDKKLTELGKPIIEQMLNDISESKQKAQTNIDELEESNKKYKKLLQELNKSMNEADKEFSQSNSETKAKVKEFTEVLDKVKTEDEFTQKDWSLKAKEAYDSDENEKAIEFYTKAIEIDSKTSVAYDSLFYRSLTYQRMGEYEKALQDGIQGLEHLETVSMFLTISRSYELLEKYPEALNYIEKVIEKDPSYEYAVQVKEEIIKKMNK